MDCNKEEAARAKLLAEEKMRAGDFVGAHKFVMKAQKLFPNLENISQMIAICDVHSSADKKISGIDNWYGILQVQYFADADTIKKQYRKLALLLHPDKNKFAGAESAFKLVGEANRLLSDQAKRSQYDVRYRSHSSLSSKQSNANSGRQYATVNSAPDDIETIFTFWSCCKHCGHRSKYLREYMNSLMHCSKCRKSYVARCDRVPSSSTGVKKEFQNQGMFNTTGQSNMAGTESGSSAAEIDKNGTVEGKLNKGNQGNQTKDAGNRKPKRDKGCTENDVEVGKSQKSVAGMNKSTEIPKGDASKPQPEVKEPKTDAAKSRPDVSAPNNDQAAKKRRKTVDESAKSFEVNGSDVAGVKTDTNTYNKRKSMRKTRQVSSANVESVDPPTKKSKSGCKFESDSRAKQAPQGDESPQLAESGVSPASSHSFKGKAKENMNHGNEGIPSATNKESKGCKANGKDADSLSKIDRVVNGCKANENYHTLDLPYPEFNVFERQRGSFAVNQVWSIRDSRGDGMPRLYARVKKVMDAESKLRITFLEPVRGKIDVSIPIACGKFKNGDTKEVEDRLIFSGQVKCLSRNKNVLIYPRKGEIWAIFRDWNETWDADLEKHKGPYKYDFVEIVSDFTDSDGLGVAYLGKIKGFVSLFHRHAQHGILQFQVPPEEMLRFSHKVPASKMIGNEREFVPADSHELDPAALPQDMIQVDAVDMEKDPKGRTHDPYPEAPKVEVNSKPVPERSPSFTKDQKSDDDNETKVSGGIGNNHGKARTRSVLPEEVKGGTSLHEFSSCQASEPNTPEKYRKSSQAANAFKLRRSPRHVSEKNNQSTPSQQSDEMKSAKHDHKTNTPKKTEKGPITDPLGIRKSPLGVQQPAKSREGDGTKKHQSNGELPTQINGATNDSGPEAIPLSSSRKSEQKKAFDFKNLRSENKFKVDSIWAVYSDDKRLPTEYVLIKKVETKPKFRLQVTPLELDQPAKQATRPVSCGCFKFKSGRPNVLPLTKFSHEVRAETKKNTVSIYPRKDEIWALYKNCNSTEEEYDIVEVVEDDKEQIIRAVPLTAKTSYSSLYIRKRTRGSNEGVIDIPKSEMSRFAHQIPAFKQDTRTTRLSERGCWELDLLAVPGRTIVID